MPESESPKPHEIKLTISTFNLEDGDLTRAVEWDRKFSYSGPPSRPVLSNGAACWLEENRIVYRTAQNPAANFLMDIYFTTESDAVLFKMFWL